MTPAVSEPWPRIKSALVLNPLRATLVVGSAILALLHLIRWASDYLPIVRYFELLVPFIPPFFITRWAKEAYAASAREPTGPGSA